MSLTSRFFLFNEATLHLGYAAAFTLHHCPIHYWFYHHFNQEVYTLSSHGPRYSVVMLLRALHQGYATIVFLLFLFIEASRHLGYAATFTLHRCPTQWLHRYHPGVTPFFFWGPKMDKISNESNEGAQSARFMNQE